MTSGTHTQAGLRALAGVARPRVVACGSPATAAPSVAAASFAAAAHAGAGMYGHQSATWTVDAIAKPATFMVLDGKNRLTRQPSELSP